MKHRAVFWVGGSVNSIIECNTSRQFAISIRKQIEQLSAENEYEYSIEVTSSVEEHTTNWKDFL